VLVKLIIAVNSFAAGVERGRACVDAKCMHMPQSARRMVYRTFSAVNHFVASQQNMALMALCYVWHWTTLLLSLLYNITQRLCCTAWRLCLPHLRSYTVALLFCPYSLHFSARAFVFLNELEAGREGSECYYEPYFY